MRFVHVEPASIARPAVLVANLGVKVVVDAGFIVCHRTANRNTNGYHEGCRDLSHLSPNCVFVYGASRMQAFRPFVALTRCADLEITHPSTGRRYPTGRRLL